MQLDSGTRGGATTFVKCGIGAILLAWENEALLAIKELDPDKVEIVAQSVSILAGPPVTVVDKVIDKRGTRKLAQAYLSKRYGCRVRCRLSASKVCTQPSPSAPTLS